MLFTLTSNRKLVDFDCINTIDQCTLFYKHMLTTSIHDIETHIAI